MVRELTYDVAQRARDQLSRRPLAELAQHRELLERVERHVEIFGTAGEPGKATALELELGQLALRLPAQPGHQPGIEQIPQPLVARAALRRAQPGSFGEREQA